MNPIYLSTGAFTGRMNGRDPMLVLKYAESFHCDGFEFMIFPEFVDNINTLLREYRSSGIKFPVLHTEKAIGNLFASEDNAEFEQSIEALKQNLYVAGELNAKKAVVHLWGRSDSDKNKELIYNRTDRLYKEAEPFGIDVLIENIFCVYGDPLSHLEAISERCPKAVFIFDTRPAQFHGQLEKTLKSDIAKKIRHMHINDYAGGYMEWDKINPIAQPQFGNVDWSRFFLLVKELGYSDSMTLEASAHVANGVDSETLNRSLDFIRNGLK